LNKSSRTADKITAAAVYSQISVIILLVFVFGILFGSSTFSFITTAIAQQQTGTIKGVGTSEITGGVCNNFHNTDFLTIKFDASYLLSSDGKTGQVTSGTGIIKTTYSKVFGYLSITGGSINMGVKPALYTLKGTASFQSFSSCDLPSTVQFSIAKPNGTQLKCANSGNSDLITFNSIPITGSVIGNAVCNAGAVTKQTTDNTGNAVSVQQHHTNPPDNVRIISAVDSQGRRIFNGAINVPSNSISFQLSKPTDNVGIASLECSIDGSTRACPSLSGGSLISYSNLNPGSHTFTFTAKDAAGNAASGRFIWTVISSSAALATANTPKVGIVQPNH
jgi:hypothetical protein